MIALSLLLTAAFAQDGAKVFQQSCAVGYCHGTGGSANRAPKLAGRSFDRAYLQRVVAKGIPSTAMPGFQGKIKDSDLAAVVEYVLTLGSGGSAATSAAAAPSSAPVQRNLPGKDLFFDPVRGTRCGTCHALEGMGTSVGPNLGAIANISSSAITGVKAQHVQTAAAAGDRFPALVLEKKGDWIRLYDLTTTPPVLRTLPARDVTLSASDWRHSAAITSYTPQELDNITEYLRSLSR